jgi:hypothetical protein
VFLGEKLRERRERKLGFLLHRTQKGEKKTFSGIEGDQFRPRKTINLHAQMQILLIFEVVEMGVFSLRRKSQKKSSLLPPLVSGVLCFCHRLSFQEDANLLQITRKDLSLSHTFAHTKSQSTTEAILHEEGGQTKESRGVGVWVFCTHPQEEIESGKKRKRMRGGKGRKEKNWGEGPRRTTKRKCEGFFMM